MPSDQKGRGTERNGKKERPSRGSRPDSSLRPASRRPHAALNQPAVAAAAGPLSHSIALLSAPFLSQVEPASRRRPPQQPLSHPPPLSLAPPDPQEERRGTGFGSRWTANGARSREREEGRKGGKDASERERESARWAWCAGPAGACRPPRGRDCGCSSHSRQKERPSCLVSHALRRGCLLLADVAAGMLPRIALLSSLRGGRGR